MRVEAGACELPISRAGADLKQVVGAVAMTRCHDVVVVLQAGRGKQATTSTRTLHMASISQTSCRRGPALPAAPV